MSQSTVPPVPPVPPAQPVSPVSPVPLLSRVADVLFWLALAASAASAALLVFVRDTVPYDATKPAAQVAPAAKQPPVGTFYNRPLRREGLRLLGSWRDPISPSLGALLNTVSGATGDESAPWRRKQWYEMVLAEAGVGRPPHGPGTCLLTHDGTHVISSWTDLKPALLTLSAPEAMPENASTVSQFFALTAGRVGLLHVHATGEREKYTGREDRLQNYVVTADGSGGLTLATGLGHAGERSMVMSIDGLVVYAAWEKHYTNDIMFDESAGGGMAAFGRVAEYPFSYTGGQVAVFDRRSDSTGMSPWETRATSRNWVYRHNLRLTVPMGDILEPFNGYGLAPLSCRFGSVLAASFNTHLRRHTVAARNARGPFLRLGPGVWIWQEPARTDGSGGARREVEGFVSYVTHVEGSVPAVAPSTDVDTSSFAESFDMGDDSLLAAVRYRKSGSGGFHLGKLLVWVRSDESVTGLAQWVPSGEVRHPDGDDTTELFGTSVRISQQTFDMAVVGSPVMVSSGSATGGGGSVFLLSRKNGEQRWAVTHRVRAADLALHTPGRAFGHWVNVDLTFRMVSISVRHRNDLSTVHAKPADTGAEREPVSAATYRGVGDRGAVALLCINQQTERFYVEKDDGPPFQLLEQQTLGDTDDVFFGASVQIALWKRDESAGVWVVVAGEPMNGHVGTWLVSTAGISA